MKMKKTITIKDINYCKNDLNKVCNTKCNRDVIDAIRLTEKDSVTYQFVTKVRDKFITIGLAGLIFACGYYVGNKLERNAFEKRAVEAGVGEYFIIDPYTGESQFEFVNPTEISRAFGMIE